jgi:hypothetical protein
MDQEDANLYNSILQTLVLLLTVFTSLMHAKKISAAGKKRRQRQRELSKQKKTRNYLKENFKNFSSTFDFLCKNNEELKNKATISAQYVDALAKHFNVSSSGSMGNDSQ